MLTFSVVHRALLTFALACLVVATGCTNSVYHRAGKTLAGDLNERLTLRIHEARQAGTLAAETLKNNPSGLEAERAELAAWDFSRRVLSVQDVLARLPEPNPEAARVLEELQRADEALTAVMELPVSERAQAWAQAAAILERALADADTFLAANNSAHAGMLKAD
jgi:hypothetical protein